MFLPGLLAKAHRGILYIDDINLLDTELCQIVLGIVTDGWVNVEVRLRIRCSFMSHDRGLTSLPGQLRDGVGTCLLYTSDAADE